METTGKVIRCRAAIAWKPKKPLKIKEVEVAPPKEHEVRIKICYSALCHTDTFTLDGGSAEEFPCILGHEGAGVVESVGKGVTGLKPGDHVIPAAIPQCRKCVFCKNPETNLCNRLRETQDQGLMADGTTRFKCKGKVIYHFMGCSTFSEYTVVADIAVAKVSEKAPLEKISLLGCGVATGYGAVLNTAKVKKGSSVAVWGLGGVGLAAVLGAKEAGARAIVGIDFNSSKFEKALLLGATECINPRDLTLSDSFQEYLLEHYNGGFDYTFECTGSAEAMQEAFESVHEGWGVSCAIGASRDMVTTHPGNLLYGRTWKGTGFGGWRCRDDVPMLVERYLDGRIPLDEFITHHFDLADINEAIGLLHSGTGLRSIMKVAME